MLRCAALPLCFLGTAVRLQSIAWCAMEGAARARAVIETVEALLAGSAQLESAEWFHKLQQQGSGLRQLLHFKVQRGCSA